MAKSTSLIDIIDEARGKCLGAVSHVGAANYASRETEAKQWVRDAFETLCDWLTEISDNGAKVTEAWRLAVAHGTTTHGLHEWKKARKPEWRAAVAAVQTELGFDEWIIATRIPETKPESKP